MRRLLKFKCDKERREVLVRYDVDRKGGGRDTITLESNEKPSVALTVQLGVIATHLIAIAELPSDWIEEFTIIGVTRTITENGTGLVITGLHELEHQGCTTLHQQSAHDGFQRAMHAGSERARAPGPALRRRG